MLNKKLKQIFNITCGEKQNSVITTQISHHGTYGFEENTDDHNTLETNLIVSA